MNEIKITAQVRKALAEVEAGNVSYAYRSAPKIKGTRLVKAMSSEWLNTKIAQGITNGMLAKLFDAELVATIYSKYGIYGVKLTAKGAEALAPVASVEVEAQAAITEAVAVKATEEIIATQVSRREIVDGLLAAAKAARTEESRQALNEAAALVSMDEHAAARKILVPLRTRQARAAIAAIKAL